MRKYFVLNKDIIFNRNTVLRERSQEQSARKDNKSNYDFFMNDKEDFRDEKCQE